MTDCPRVRKWFRSCHFEGRYDIGPADFSQFSSVKSANRHFADSLRKETYVRDVCTTCGKTIERTK